MLPRIKKLRIILAIACCTVLVGVRWLVGQQPGGLPPAMSTGPGAMAAPGGYPGGMGMAGPLSEAQQAEKQLSLQARDVLKSYAAETNAESRTERKRQLRTILITQFDLQHSRRDEELKKIEKRLAELRSRLNRRADAKTTIVDRRLEQLISEVDGLGWGSEDVPNDLFDVGAMPGMSGGGNSVGPMSAGPMGGGFGPSAAFRFAPPSGTGSPAGLRPGASIPAGAAPAAPPMIPSSEGAGSLMPPSGAPAATPAAVPGGAGPGTLQPPAAASVPTGLPAAPQPAVPAGIVTDDGSNNLSIKP